MNAPIQHLPTRSGPVRPTGPLKLKCSCSDMQMPKPPMKWIDHDRYVKDVLQIPSDTTEEEIDRMLKQNADELGIHALKLSTDVETITSSLSATTISSDPTNQSSIMSRSTAPTSCSSSEVRMATAASQSKLELPLSPMSSVPSILSDMEKKRRGAGFRKGFRRMAGFSKKRKISSPISPALSGIQGFFDLDSSTTEDAHSIASDLKSPSIKSKESSGLWSNRLSTAGISSYEQEPRIDPDALRRSMECKEMISLRAKQLEERQRFLDYQSELVSKIRAARDLVKAQKSVTNRRLVEEQMERNDKAVEDLESRQLEEELRMLKEHEIEKRTIMVRLRYMQAYCQTPSPPPTPSDPTFIPRVGSPPNSDSGRGSVDSVGATYSPITIPERRVTDKDYHNLAQQYRERDVMDNLHSSKINVLRGKQKRAVENFVVKREREVDILEREQLKGLDAIDLEFGKQEAECRAEFDVRRRRLENRWRLEAKIEKKKREDTTGLRFESLPDVLCVDNCSMDIMLRPTNTILEVW